MRMEPVFEHTLNNHFKWGWGDEWYGSPQPDKKYKIHIGHTTRSWGSLRQESVNAARLIADRATKPIIIGLSGGSDSQMACLSFRDAGVPFKVIIVKYCYANGDVVNQHDISVAYEFCKKFNIEYLELAVDIDAFFRGRGAELARKYCMPKVETIIQTMAMDHVGKDYCFVMAGGDIMIHSLSFKSAALYGLKTYEERFGEPCHYEQPVPILQHMIENRYEGTSKFWLYTPELIASYLTDPITQSYLNTFDVIMSAWTDQSREKANWKLFHWFYKPLMTYREFPELIRSKKFTGYENLYAGMNDVPSRMSVYKAILKNEVADLDSEKVVILSIDNLIKYITTPHSLNDVLVDQGAMI